MLQKFGLLRYNSNFIFKKENSNRIFPVKSFNNRNLYTQKNTKIKNNSCKSLKYNTKTSRLQKEDIIFQNELYNFIEESTANNKIKIAPSNLIKIRHNIDDNIIKRNDLKLNSSYKSKNNLKYFKFNDYNIYNMVYKEIKKDKNKTNEKDSKIKLIHNVNENNNIQSEINAQKMLINNLEINNKSLENKINIIKNEYNNNLLKNTDINKVYNNNLFNLKYMKSNTNSNNDELISLKKDIIELKNQILINSKEQKIINLVLFKEKMENELNKEDINKMNKLIENINKEIEDKRNEISEMMKKSKLLLGLINLNIVPENEKNKDII